MEFIQNQQTLVIAKHSSSVVLGRHIKKMRKQFLTSRSFQFSGIDTCKPGKCNDTDEHPQGALQTESNSTMLEETPVGRRQAVCEQS